MFVYPFCFPHSAGFNPRTHTGATNLEFACTYPARRFNPRTHTGCDPITLYARLAVVKFQSTHPHGVRLYIQQMSEYQLNKVSISRS